MTSRKAPYSSSSSLSSLGRACSSSSSSSCFLLRVDILFGELGRVDGGSMGRGMERRRRGKVEGEKTVPGDSSWGRGTELTQKQGPDPALQQTPGLMVRD